MGPELMVPCPSCGAKAGHRCKVQEKFDDGKIVHISRARKYGLWKASLLVATARRGPRKHR